MSAATTALVGATATASAVLGGALFAFSSFVMPGLRALPAAAGMAAMQSINRAAPRSLLLVPLLGSALGSAAIGIHAAVAGGIPDRGLRLAGAALGVAAFAITVGANIPRNNALATLAPDAPTAADAWTAYVTSWTRWNHARTLAAISSAVILAEVLRRNG
jgi:uncharacterized membrane protein